MSTFEITRPVEGKVVLELDLKDAEILLRALGRTNVGNLAQNSPVLSNFVDEMVKVFGRDRLSEAQNYVSQVSVNQIFIDHKDTYK